MRNVRCAILVALWGWGPQHVASAQDNPGWQFGGFADIGRLEDFNAPANHLFRHRGTTPRVDEWDLNMMGVAINKNADDSSPWGFDLTVQTGKDAETFGFSATAPNSGGADWLRHLGAAYVSYRASDGQLSVQGGIFNSLIGYDSLYPKDNFTYTRPWGADYTPYLMMGVNATYRFNANLTGTALVVNGYWHLAHANNVPSFGGQLAYRASDQVTVKQTVLYGPHQSNTALEFWRLLSDSIVERRSTELTAALEYQFGEEKVDGAGNPRALWTAAQLPIHWRIGGPWSATIRPEFCWDRDGRWTGSELSVRAVTTTIEHRMPYRHMQTIVRLEHRYDHSRGPGSGFFDDGEVRSGVVGLTSGQQLLIVALIVSVETNRQ